MGGGLLQRIGGIPTPQTDAEDQPAVRERRGGDGRADPSRLQRAARRIFRRRKETAMALRVDHHTVRDDGNRRVWHGQTNHSRLTEKGRSR